MEFWQILPSHGVPCYIGLTIFILLLCEAKKSDNANTIHSVQYIAHSLSTQYTVHSKTISNTMHSSLSSNDLK
jgi:hypothetical protein